MCILVLEKHPGKRFPHIWSLRKQSAGCSVAGENIPAGYSSKTLNSSVVVGKLNSDYNIYIIIFIIINKSKRFLRKKLCTFWVPKKQNSHRFAAVKS